MTEPARQRACGHRSVPHTADLRIEAWGPTREDCIAEALRGLVESFADVGRSEYRRVVGRHLTAGSDADLLAAAVEEDLILRVVAGVQVMDASAFVLAREHSLTMHVFDIAAAGVMRRSDAPDLRGSRPGHPHLQFVAMPAGSGVQRRQTCFLQPG